jgi:hypothetical protein
MSASHKDTDDTTRQILSYNTLLQHQGCPANAAPAKSTEPPPDDRGPLPGLRWPFARHPKAEGPE